MSLGILIYLQCLQVRLDNDGELQILLNSSDISDSMQVMDDINMESNVVSLRRDSDNSIDVFFVNGVSLTVTHTFGLLSFVLMVPLVQEIHKTAAGLLGNFNEESSDDFTYPNGSVLDGGSSDEEIYNFGQSCEFAITSH
jgi:hypothetical protein